MWKTLCFAYFASLLLAAGAYRSAADATTPERHSTTPADVEMSPISGDIDHPRRHFRVRDPADLGPSEAEQIYAIAKSALAVGYRRSENTIAESYSTWTRYNTAPYLSSTHGNHYLNNYANAIAAAYGSYERAGELPVGSIIAKDSFSYTDSGAVILGPLFLMEKMPKGFNEVSSNWKYSLIQPNGAVFGETRGLHTERVDYCIDCHLAAEEHDHLFFVPDAYRVP